MADCLKSLEIIDSCVGGLAYHLSLENDPQSFEKIGVPALMTTSCKLAKKLACYRAVSARGALLQVYVPEGEKSLPRLILISLLRVRYFYGSKL